MTRRKKIIFGGLLLFCVAALCLIAFARGGVTTRRFQPTRTNEFNLLFELPHPSPTPARKLPFIINITDSIQDLPYYIYSNRSVRATNADVLFDRPVKGVRQFRVYKSESPEWKFEVRRTVTTHLWYRKFWGNPPVGAIKIRERQELWVSDTLVNKHLQPIKQASLK